MPHVIVALSGPAAVGQDDACALAGGAVGATIVHTHDLVASRAGADRGHGLGELRALQEFGERLDRETGRVGRR